MTIPVIQLETPVDLATSIPYILGHRPVESMVIAGFIDHPNDKRRLGPVVRWDLDCTGDEHRGMMNRITGTYAGAGVTSIVIMAFSATRQRELIWLAEDTIGRQFNITDSFRVDGLDLWYETDVHLTCNHPLHMTIESDVDMQLVGIGLNFTETRDSLLEPYLFQPGIAEAVAAVTDMPPYTEAHERALSSTADVSIEDLAALIQSAHEAVDLTLASLSRDRARDETRVWTQAARASVNHRVLCVAAVSAWLTGNGTLANVVLDQANDLEPGNGLVRILMNLVMTDPSGWAKLQPMIADRS